MKVLLLGDFSGFHLNLATGLKQLGIEAKVASAGDVWKNIPRDIDLKQPEKFKRIGFLNKLIKNYKNLTGYDVVQFITPNFLITNPRLTSFYFDLIKNHNEKYFVSACTMDYQHVSYALAGKLKHSVFYNKEIADDPYVTLSRNMVLNKSFKNVEKKIVRNCNGVIATSNGYYNAYRSEYKNKTTYIPLPVDTEKFKYICNIPNNLSKVHFFLGVMKERAVIKGADRIGRVLSKLEKKYPNDVKVKFVDSVPYTKYTEILNASHVLCDQLYEYGLGMNAVIGLSKGLILAGCADEEMYDIIGEKENKPILNINSSDEEMFRQFEMLLEQKNNLKDWSLKSREYAEKHHDCIKVAQQYLDFWKSK